MENYWVHTQNRREEWHGHALLFQSISEALTLQVGDLETAKTVWDAIKARHVGAERVREARLQTLMTEFRV